MRNILILIGCAFGLSGCAQVRTHLAFWHYLHHRPTALAQAAAPAQTADRAPQIAPGLWAMLDPGCEKPATADTSKWPRCAQPFWIGGDYAVVVQRRPAGARSVDEAGYRADYRLAAGAPLIAEVGVQEKGRLFIALTGLSHDGEGRLVGAAAAAFACPDKARGVIRASAAASGCEAAAPDALRAAARASLSDPAALERVAFIAEGAPSY